MNHKEAEVNIIPISKTMLQSHSFGGIVDFLVTQGHSKYNSAPTSRNNPCHKRVYYKWRAVGLFCLQDRHLGSRGSGNSAGDDISIQFQGASPSSRTFT